MKTYTNGVPKCAKFERLKKIIFNNIVFKAIFFFAHVLIVMCIFNSKKNNIFFKVWAL